MSGLFATVLVANRGEVAVRIMRTLRGLGIRSVAVYSDADAAARHVVAADDALRIGPPPARHSYLDVERVVGAARRAGADALHPGYGFLAENPLLAEACKASGITFIGPAPSAIALMGDKIRAREAVSAVGVPVVRGGGGAGLSDEQVAAVALEIGLPVLLKPSAGGGGKGMRLVSAPGALASEVAASRREAMAAFGDDTLLVERFVPRPRHIEVQVAADDHGDVVHLGERECSLQRRHQKIIEEAPSPFITPATRAAMGAEAIKVARACGYTNIGTVEMIVSGDRPEDFYFMEMNTRLQVEHPVTEAIYGVDLVELQLRLAAGEPLPWSQEDLEPAGHAIEARVYAEDPEHGFLPTGGRVLRVHEPAREGIRVDSGVCAGTWVGTEYDPMLAKVVASGGSREEAIDRLRAALGETAVLGVTTNIGFLRDLLGRDDVRAGDIDTGLVERVGVVRTPVPDAVLIAAWMLYLAAASGPGLWGRTDGWRLGAPAWARGEVEADGRLAVVRVRSAAHAWLASLDGAEPVPVHTTAGDERLVLRTDAGSTTFEWAFASPSTVWLASAGRAWEVRIRGGPGSYGDHSPALGSGPVLSPMPGTVVTIAVQPGEAVSAGQAVAVIEAMKMEHTLVAPFDGTVSTVHVKPGEQVAIRQPIVTVAPTDDG